MSIKALRRNDVADIGLPSEVQIQILGLNITITAGIAISRGYHHSDWQPRRENDVIRLINALRGRWSWTAQPAMMIWRMNGKEHRTACAIHTMPHGEHLHGRWSFRIQGSSYQLNGEGNAGHFCLHYIDSMAIRFQSNQNSRNWWQSMNDAVSEAVRLFNNTSPPIIAPPPVTNVEPPTRVTHKVVNGDTMTRIALQYGMTLEQLRVLNPQIADIDRIKAGQIINIMSQSTTPMPLRTHKVVANDTFTRIANRYGLSIAELRALNPQIVDIDRIQIGQVINLAA